MTLATSHLAPPCRGHCPAPRLARAHRTPHAAAVIGVKRCTACHGSSACRGTSACPRQPPLASTPPPAARPDELRADVPPLLPQDRTIDTRPCQASPILAHTTVPFLDVRFQLLLRREILTAQHTRTRQQGHRLPRELPPLPRHALHERWLRHRRSAEIPRR